MEIYLTQSLVDLIGTIAMWRGDSSVDSYAAMEYLTYSKEVKKQADIQCPIYDESLLVIAGLVDYLTFMESNSESKIVDSKMHLTKKKYIKELVWSEGSDESENL
jgi:hypothetical protein